MDEGRERCFVVGGVLDSGEGGVGMDGEVSVDEEELGGVGFGGLKELEDD